MFATIRRFRGNSAGVQEARICYSDRRFSGLAIDDMRIATDRPPTTQSEEEPNRSQLSSAASFVSSRGHFNTYPTISLGWDQATAAIPPSNSANWI